jgi:hypothetical protein
MSFSANARVKGGTAPTVANAGLATGIRQSVNGTSAALATLVNGGDINMAVSATCAQCAAGTGGAALPPPPLIASLGTGIAQQAIAASGAASAILSNSASIAFDVKAARSRSTSSLMPLLPQAMRWRGPTESTDDSPLEWCSSG